MSASPVPPAATKCPFCGSLECGPVRCRFTMDRRFQKVSLHPALTHAQAQKVCSDIGAKVIQDSRGFLGLTPVDPEAA